MKKNKNCKSIDLIFEKNQIVISNKILGKKIISNDYFEGVSFNLLCKLPPVLISGRLFSNKKAASENIFLKISFLRSLIEMRWKRLFLMSQKKNELLFELLNDFSQGFEYKVNFVKPINFLKREIFSYPIFNLNLKSKFYLFASYFVYLLRLIKFLRIAYKDVYKDLLLLKNQNNKYGGKTLCMTNFLRQRSNFDKFVTVTKKQIDLAVFERALLTNDQIHKRFNPKEINFFNLLYTRILLFKLIFTRLINTKRKNKNQSFISLFLVFIFYGKLNRFRKIAEEIFDYLKPTNLLILDSWEQSWALYFQSKINYIPANTCLLTCPDPDVHLLKRAGDKIFTNAPSVMKGLVLRGKQKGEFLFDKKKIENKKNLQKTGENGILWFQTYKTVGMISNEEILESLRFACTISKNSNKKLHLKFRPNHKDDITRNRINEILIKSKCNFFIHDTNLSLKEIASKCDTLIWTLSSGVAEVIPFIDWLIVDSSKKLNLKNCQFLYDFYMIKELQEFWNSFSIQEITTIISSKDTCYKKDMKLILDKYIKKSYSFTDDMTKYRESWLKVTK